MNEPKTAPFHLLRGATRGFAAGLVATTTMSAAMFVLQKAGLLGRMPPRILTEKALARFGLRRRTSTSTRKVLTALAHWGFGGVSGAVYEVARTAVAARRGRPTSLPALLASGIGFGTFVWASSYMGWIPSLGLMPAPKYDRPGRPASMVFAHWVFGGTLAAAVGTPLASRPVEVNR